ncbi:MAG: hypothetical protein WDN26_13440 [Chitinophagaceae bacterium]
MKKIFTISSILILSVVFLAGCTKHSYNNGDDLDYWLSKENGVVVYSDDFCPYYVWKLIPVTPSSAPALVSGLMKAMRYMVI